MPSTLDSRQLLAFATLARRRSFTETARELFLTQSAISHAIRALEEDVGLRLFERQGKRVSLTFAGEQLLSSATRILAEMHASRATLRRYSNWGHGHVRWGVCGSLGAAPISAILRAFRAESPRCEVRTEAGDGPALLELLGRGRLDLALMMEPVGEHDFVFQPFFETSLRLMVAADHPWAAAGVLPREDEATETLLFYRCGRDTASWVRARAARVGARFAAFCDLGSIESLKGLVLAGRGVGVLAPWMAEAELESGAFKTLSLPGEPEPRAWGLVRLRAHALTLQQERFSAVCARILSPLGQAAEAPAAPVKKASPTLPAARAPRPRKRRVKVRVPA